MRVEQFSQWAFGTVHGHFGSYSEGGWARYGFATDIEYQGTRKAKHPKWKQCPVLRNNELGKNQV